MYYKEIISIEMSFLFSIIKRDNYFPETNWKHIILITIITLDICFAKIVVSQNVFKKYIWFELIEKMVSKRSIFGKQLE